MENRAYRNEALVDHTGNNDRVHREEATSSLFLHSSIPLYGTAGYAAHIPNKNLLILRKCTNAVRD